MDRKRTTRMGRKLKLDFLNSEFCCISESEVEKIKHDYKQGNYASIYEFQRLNMEKTSNGYKCNRCGKEFPARTLIFKDKEVDINKIKRMKYKPIKIKGSNDIAVINDRLYVDSSKGFLVYDLSEINDIKLIKSYPFKRNYYRSVVSPDEKYVVVITLKNQIIIYSLETGKWVAEKKIGTYIEIIWNKDSKSLYYTKKDKIFQWLYETDEERIVWYPKEVKENEIISFCKCMYDFDGESYLFWGNRKYPFVIKISTSSIEECIIQMKWGMKQISLDEEEKNYIAVSLSEICILNEDFEITGNMESPMLKEYSDGGGCFPICCIDNINPDAIILSADGKWGIFDYMTAFVLINLELNQIKFCFSRGASPITVYGFYKSKYMIYGVGFTVYIQEIDEE